MQGNEHITLSQLQLLIKETIADRFRGGVWIVAEIGELKVNASSGHCYMELVEKGGANGIPKARVSATVWRHVYGMLSSYFSAATGEDIKPGMKVLLKVTVTYHELYGLSLNVSDIDPMYTMGDLERQRQETIAQLQEDGVFDLNREIEIPVVVQRIALISSPNAAGYQDFMNELLEGGYYFEVELFDAVMQGHGAEDSIIDALSRIASKMENFDAVAIIRGGGSQSDLSFLNSYMLNYHIAQFPLPVIAGLGHDKDQSILDMVAARSLKTPTAVAGFFTQKAAALDAELDEAYATLSMLSQKILSNNQQRLQYVATALSKNGISLTHRIELRLQYLQGEIVRRQQYFMARQKSRLDNFEVLLGDRSRNAFISSERKLDNMLSLIESRNPEKILNLGFAIVTRNGKTLRDAGEVRIGEELKITLAKGKVSAKVESKT